MIYMHAHVHIEGGIIIHKLGKIFLYLCEQTFDPPDELSESFLCHMLHLKIVFPLKYEKQLKCYHLYKEMTFSTNVRT